MTDDLSLTEFTRKVRQHIRYDRNDGLLFWRHRGQEFFDCKKKAQAWNARNENKPALNATYPSGALGGMFFGKRLWACDVVWLFELGDWPHGVIHQRNGDKSDNRISNLVIVDPQIACPKTGFIGVLWNSYFKKWEARIELPDGGGRKYLGYFDDPQDAAITYDNAAKEHWGNRAALNFKEIE